jgi:dihydrodipicolinate reductase
LPLFWRDYDVEIIERHHHNKVDAPAGTAIMLADAPPRRLPYEAEYVYERQSVRQPRAITRSHFRVRAAPSGAA